MSQTPKKIDIGMKDALGKPIHMFDNVVIAMGSFLHFRTIVGKNDKTDKVWALSTRLFEETNEALQSQNWITPTTHLPERVLVIGSFAPTDISWCQRVRKKYIREALLEYFN